ncbi:MAG: hypothetical protein GKR89_36340 [Candidatus Latescibacteria bacterium]|nr:hypothetical protein [Candidatus Latescibacterota bacterium]
MSRISKLLQGSVLLLVLVGSAQAHVGDQVFPIYELADGDLEAIDLRDGQVSEWEQLIGGPTLSPGAFVAYPDVGQVPAYDPDDLDYRIWLAWHRSTQRIYVATQRIDDVHIAYAGEEPEERMWRYDIIEFMVDGDHSGGTYHAFHITEDDNPPDGDLLNGRTAQHFWASASAPGGRPVWYFGAGNDWVTRLPYADGGGGSQGVNPTTTAIEFFVTPFDDLVYDRPDSSRVSTLYVGKIIGFQISVPDFDEEPGAYRGFYTLYGQTATWRDADRFVDGQLLGPQATAVEGASWARIKASFR